MNKSQCHLHKKRLALALVGALFLGILPPGTTPVSTAADVSEAGCELNNPTRNSEGVTTWDCVYFGNYPQNDTNRDAKVDENDAREPIKWRVLSVDGDDVFLLADRNLECQKYNRECVDVTWETCTMRSWLNGYGADYTDNNFICNAFTADEQAAIKNTTVVNADNAEYGTEGGNDTTDRVYLLSVDEVLNPSYGFTSDCEGFAKSRRAKNTSYAQARGAKASTRLGYEGNGSWRLRSPGSSSEKTSFVYFDGDVEMGGRNVDASDFCAVRPALHLNLSSNPGGWSYAGKVTSDSEDFFTWNCIYFGNYPQNDTNHDGEVNESDAKEPIKWRVLSVNGDDAFLLADQNLDCQAYNDIGEDVTWEMCTLRSWLNGYGAESNMCGKDYTDDNFISNAFTADEQAAIKNTTVVNADNISGVWSTEGGDDTTDRVYLLSLDEMAESLYGFTDSKSKRAKNTPYAISQGAWTAPMYVDYGGNGHWWLRSPGRSANWAASVDGDGYVSDDGTHVNYSKAGVRPVLHLDLSSSVWSNAGTITSNGIVTMNPESSPTVQPSATPTVQPSILPTMKPSASPTVTPSASPTVTPNPSGLNNPMADSEGVTTWDIVTFGTYWQSDTNGDGIADKNDAKEPIQWRVLSVSEDGKDALLLADKSLDCRRYNDTKSEVTWETCTMRSWLNGYGAERNICGEDYTANNFIDNAFTAEEQTAIQETALENADNSSYNTEGGNDTTDKVYLLSIDEVMKPSYGFMAALDRTDKRKTKNTLYAQAQGAVARAGNSWWWLRTPGHDNTTVCMVFPDGYIERFGGYANEEDNAVRPALHLNLSSSVWSRAGTIISDGKFTDIESLPSASPTVKPGETPTVQPSASPTIKPGETPTAMPGETPTVQPSASPTIQQGGTSGVQPGETSSVKPGAPSSVPSVSPSRGDALTDKPDKSDEPDEESKSTAQKPAKVTGLKLKAKKKAIQVSWKKAAGANGYELWYSATKKWNKKKTKTTKKTKLTLGKLKSKKTYYIRVRAYTIQNGKKAYGMWSKTVKKKVK